MICDSKNQSKKLRFVLKNINPGEIKFVSEILKVVKKLFVFIFYSKFVSIVYNFNLHYENDGKWKDYAYSNPVYIYNYTVINISYLKEILSH